MARTRSIKPSFFDNELLGGLSPLTRLLFIGLWGQADRAGRLEDRPLRLKKNILGYDDVTVADVDNMLESLNTNGFIIRYQVEDRSYIQVTKFEKHQNPHIKEKPSEIPPPPSLEEDEGGPGAGQPDGAANEGLGAVMSLFLNRINPTPSQTSLDELKGYAETLSPEVCLKAINKAIDGGAEKQNWNYIRGILRNLAKQKVRNVADWDRLEAERERRKHGANRKGPGPDHGKDTGPPGAEGAGAGIGGFHPAESADE